MPRLPDEMSFGVRQSLRSNRVDQVYEDGVAIAESVATASQKVAELYGQKKAKDDRLNYALAKNEIVGLDIAERENLKERQDWEKFDEDYTKGFNTGRDNIFGRYRLSNSDRALLQAESDLIREKGRVHAGDLSHGVKVDWSRARISEQLDAATEAVQVETPENQNNLMLQAMETISAAEEKGYFTEQEAVNLRQGFVSKTAVSSLNNMEPADRIAEIELSLAHRKARGPITPEDIQGNGGTGSIADFLHKDVLTKMLRESKEEDKQSTQYNEIFAIVDEVAQEYQTTDSEGIKSRREMALSMLDKNDPDYGEKRVKLIAQLKSRNAEDAMLESMTVEENTQKLTNMIDEAYSGDNPEGFDLGKLRTNAVWSKLSPQAQATLEKYVDLRASGREFALSDDTDLEYKLRSMTPEEIVAEIPKFDTAEYKTKLTRSTWESFLGYAQATRDAKKSTQAPNLYKGDPQDEILDNMLVGDQGLFKRVPLPGSKDHERYRRIDAAVDRALKAESVRRLKESGDGRIYPTEIEKITAEVISQQVFIRKGWFDDPLETVEADVIRMDVDPVTGRKTPVFTEDAKEAYIPYERWQHEISDVPNPTGTGYLTTEEMLKNLAPNQSLSKKDLEEAYFYLNALPEPINMDYARRRLRGEKGL